MTKDEVLRLVLEIYTKNGWTMLNENISIQLEEVKTGFFFPKVEKRIWHVMTNIGYKGGNGVFEFDDETGEILKQVILPR